MPPHEHRAHVVTLGDRILVLEHAVDPARDRDALGVHHVLGLVLLTVFADVLLAILVVGHVIETALDPCRIKIPDPSPVSPGTGSQAVVAGQRIGEHAEVGRALHVVMTTEDVGAATGYTDIAECQLERAVGPGVVVADRVLGAAHAPDEGAGTVVGHRLGCRIHLVLRYPGDALDLVRRPLGDLGHDLFHAVDALADVLLVFPAILEDVVHHAPDDRYVGARADAQEVVGMRSGAGETRVDHDHRCIVFLLGLEDVLQRYRVRLGRVGTNQQDRARLVDVVVAVGHCTVAPGVGNTRDRGRVTDARLVVDVVGAPHRGELAVQVGLLVVEFCRAQPVNRIGSGLLADLGQLATDVVQCLVPRDLLPLAVDQLGRILEAAFAMAVLAHRRALGAMCPEIERMVEGRFLAGPDAVFHLGDYPATDRAVSTDGPYLFSSTGLCTLGSRGPAHHAGGKAGGQCAAAGKNPGMAQEITTAELASGPDGRILRRLCRCCGTDLVGYLFQFHSVLLVARRSAGCGLVVRADVLGESITLAWFFRAAGICFSKCDGGCGSRDCRDASRDTGVTQELAP